MKVDLYGAHIHQDVADCAVVVVEEPQRALVRALAIKVRRLQQFLDVDDVDVEMDAVDAVGDAGPDAIKVRVLDVVLDNDARDFLQPGRDALLRCVFVPGAFSHVCLFATRLGVTCSPIRAFCGCRGTGCSV